MGLSNPELGAYQDPNAEKDFLKDLNVQDNLEKWSNVLPDNSQQEFGDLHKQREIWLKENFHSFKLEPKVPLNIAGLKRISGPLPSTRNFFRRLTSVERNGLSSWWTIHFRTLSRPILFLIGTGWTFVNYQIQGYNNERFENNHEEPHQGYYKLEVPELPESRMWTRPGN